MAIFFGSEKPYCGYSKLVLRDAWNIQKGIKLIRSPSRVLRKHPKRALWASFWKCQIIPRFECFLGIVELYHSDSFSRRQVCDSWRVWEMLHVVGLTWFKRAVFVKNIIECNNNVYLYSPKLILNYIAAAALLPVQSSYTIRWWFSSFFCSTILEISM